MRSRGDDEFDDLRAKGVRKRKEDEDLPNISGVPYQYVHCCQPAF